MPGRRGAVWIVHHTGVERESADRYPSFGPS